MPDLSNELTSIRNDERGEDVRDSIIFALKKLDASETNLQPSEPRPVSSAEAYNILHMFEDGTNYSYPVYELDEITIDGPGEYLASEQNLEGFSKVTVTDFGKNLIEKDINQSGTYIAKNEGAYGYSKVNVSIHDHMAAKNITANGTYQASDDSLDGYSKVTVNVEPTLVDLDATINGIYHAPEGSDGYATVNVNVQPTLQEKIVTQNGLVRPDDAYDGLSQVIVNIPAETQQNVYTSEDEGKVVNNSALVKQSSRIINENGTYDTTLNNIVQVNVTGAGDGSNELERTAKILDKTISGKYENSYCTSIGTSVFARCFSLAEVSFPACTYIGSYAFILCSSLTEVSFPACTYISSYAFAQCSSLTEVIFPVCTYIASNAFYACISLASINFPVCQSIASSAFVDCPSLTEAAFPECTYIGGSAFRSCNSLSILKLLGSQVVRLAASTAFSSTPITNSTYLGYFGSIYVPESLYSQYLSASVWSLFSSRFVSVSETT